LSNYTKATNFTAKDGLPAGNSSKVVKGVELDTEFTAIAAAITSKADSNSPTFTGTPLAPTASAGTNNTQLATTAFVTTALAGAFPTGGIIMWSGSIASVPSGWALCDGSNGTPDLRNRFVVGAGSTYAVAATGGSADAIAVSHTHTASTSAAGNHQHYTFNGSFYSGSDIASNTYPAWADGAGDQQYNIKGTGSVPDRGLTNTAGNHTHTVTVNSTGSSGTNANLPPYYALAYIMKL
jgi:hypothetical protein